MLGQRIYFAGLRDRIVANAHRRLVLVFGPKSRNRCDLLPQFFRDEGDQGVTQAKDGLKGANQRAPCGTCLRGAALLNLYFSNLQVPITELIPDKFVDGVGHQIESIVFEALRNLRFHALEHGTHPTVGLTELHVTMKGSTRSALLFGVLFQATVLPLAIHHDKTCGVP